jgi:WD40 repeat protein
VRLWDMRAHRRIGGFSLSRTGPVNSVAFSRDGTMLAAAGADGTVRLWDIAKEQQKGAPFTSNLRFESVAFGPRGKILATADDDGTVRLWNDTILKRFAAHRSIGTPLIGGARMYSVAFNPRGRTLATVAGDGKARLWDVASHQQIGAPLPAGHGPVTDVAFSPDGKMLVTTSRDGGTRLWNISLPRDLVRQVCSIAHESLDLRTWQTYIPGDEPFRQVCPR